MIQYINKIPSKIEFFEMVRSEYGDENVQVPELSKELDETITAICAYKGDRLVGMGRIKKEESLLCIEDLIVKIEPLKEEIQKNIIISLIREINRIKIYDNNVRACLQSNGIEQLQNNIIEDNPNKIVGA